ncbi:MAG: hypothetical protein ACI4DK_05580 [Lachnospiraceae bacterium]
MVDKHMVVVYYDVVAKKNEYKNNKYCHRYLLSTLCATSHRKIGE